MPMRRDFLKGALASLMLPTLGRAAVPEPPWLIGFKNPPAADLTAEAEIEGRWPGELRGTFYRIGPAQHERAGVRYEHWFDGDGMAQAWRIAEGRVRHRARMVLTPKYLAEEAAGRFLYPAFGTEHQGMRPVDSPNAVNAANINLIRHGGRLLALWEGGEAVELEDEALATRGFRTLSAETRGAPFSAHPRIEADGTLWNFGAAPWAGAMVLYRLAPDGQLAKAVSIAMPHRAMVHDFVATERHLVIVFPSLVLEGERGSFLERHRFKPDLPMVALVISKDDLRVVRRYELPPGFVFHYGNGFEEADGTIRFDACVYPDAGVLDTLGQVMAGRSVRSRWAETTLVALRPDGRAELERLPGEVEFPRVDPRVAGRRNRMLYSCIGTSNSEQAFHPFFVGVQRRDLRTGALDRFRFAPEVMVEEHVFVPLGAGETDGWLLGTALDTVRRQTQLQLFRADDLAAGPIAVARLPYALPLGLHGNFVPG